MMVSPTGRFEQNTRLCLSMSDFHPETWTPAWRADTIIVGLLSFMLDPAEPFTTGAIRTSTATKRDIALRSYEWLKNNDHVFRKMFPDLMEESKFHPGRGFFHGLTELPSTAAFAISETKRFPVSNLLCMICGCVVALIAWFVVRPL